MPEDIAIQALAKGNERYVLIYSEANRLEALRTLGRWASDPELSFGWFEAVVLSQRIRATEECCGK